jgi:hypothetical protein
MAYPGEPSGPAAKGLGAFAGGRLTADEFDQLAAAFRPSWELDEAPFVGAGSMSPSDLHALQGGGGTRAEIRAVAQAASPLAPAPAPVVNGAHAAPKPAGPSHEPEDSVIVDRSITAVPIAPPPVHPRVAMAAPAVAIPPQVSADRLAQTRIVHRPAVPVSAPRSAPRESTGSFDARALRSRRPLWIGLGAGAVALVAAGIWAASGSSQAPAPVVPVLVKTVRAAAPDIPPPPPDTTPTPAAPPPKTVPVSALAQVPAPVVTTAPPPPAPVRPAAAPAAPPPAPAPHAAVAPTPRPAARPKAAAGTIVHDVPF